MVSCFESKNTFCQFQTAFYGGCPGFTLVAGPNGLASTLICGLMVNYQLEILVIGWRFQKTQSKCLKSEDSSLSDSPGTRWMFHVVGDIALFGCGEDSLIHLSHIRAAAMTGMAPANQRILKDWKIPTSFSYARVEAASSHLYMDLLFSFLGSVIDSCIWQLHVDDVHKQEFIYILQMSITLVIQIPPACVCVGGHVGSRVCLNCACAVWFICYLQN